jgi:hypothetical protein
VVGDVNVKSVPFHGQNVGAGERSSLNSGTTEAIGSNNGVCNLRIGGQQASHCVGKTDWEVDEDVPSEGAADVEGKKNKSNELETHRTGDQLVDKVRKVLPLAL